MRIDVPWWLKQGHVQTVAPIFDRKAYTPPTRHQSIELDDGDFIEVNWFDQGSGPLFILLPGMGGSFNSTYIRVLADHLWHHGYSSVVLESRGAVKPNRLARFYHAAAIDDLGWLIGELRKLNRPLLGVGFSLGGNVLARWLAESGKDCGLKAAATVSMTFDLSSTARLACRGLNRIYQARVLASYMRTAKAKLHLPEYKSRHHALRKVRTMFEFDNLITAPINGFGNARNYYARASSSQFLSSIRIPGLVLGAADDPLIQPATWPSQASLPDHVRIMKTEHGGHLGFVGTGRNYYFPEKLITFFRGELSS
jgi:uncharacterized protein